ncbi:hypothetical protein BC829DRAFT_388464 [Chytridium lagenaria]|nr:hypothetical protein BC829DRAFT_388464 [Chytridium lagenaria]
MPTTTKVLAKDEILRLIVNQLQDYGFNSISQVVAEACGVSYNFSPSSRLAELCAAATYGESGDVGGGGGGHRDKDMDDEDDREGEGLNLESATGCSVISLSSLSG